MGLKEGYDFGPDNAPLIKGKNEIMERVIIFGEAFGVQRIGYMTNPETEKRPGYIEINGEKVVCLAKGGECRHNPRYFGFNISWETPIIEDRCPNECSYKALVCDEHPDGECNSRVIRNPEHNKFLGQFSKYCREFPRLDKK